ncbi:MAG: NAD+ synthase [Verrucomicrobia bacterium]|nr:NAD+ synthase [Verrucomicrobiota bacterium]
MKILIAQLNPTIGAFEANMAKILAALDLAREQGADLVLFPELATTGYPPEDLLLLPDFLNAAAKCLDEVIANSANLTIIIGTIRLSIGGDKPLHNTAAVIENGKLLGFQDKTLLPTYDVFDERRYFAPGEKSQLWNLCGKKVGITICEDIWEPQDRQVGFDEHYHPVSQLALLGPQLLVNLSASPYSYEKKELRLHTLVRTAQRLKCTSILCNQIGGNDSLIFDGHSLVVDSSGHLRAQGNSFEEDAFLIDTEHLPPPKRFITGGAGELFDALVLGLRDYMGKSGFKTALIGLSGGIDSAVVACIAVCAVGAKNVIGITMPSRYSSESSVEDSLSLARNLQIECLTIPIEPPFQCLEQLLAPYFKGKAPDVTEENLQARTRGQILMAMSNKHGHLVLSTGNKSEMAMGYATLYGDMCGGLAVINDVSKLQVYELARWINRDQEVIPKSTLLKPPSAELAEGQKDSDSLPDYAILDAVLVAYIEKRVPPKIIAEKFEIPLSLVEDLVHRIHRNEYKRRQAPPGLRVTEKAFSIGRRFPIVQNFH